jgi:ferric-dicitrate binding protein FerR (iron transport regulator)/TolA-binding protein
VSRSDDADARIVSALSEEARRQADADAAELPRPGAWHRLEQRRAGPPRRAVRWWAAGLGLTVASAAAVVFGLHSWRSGRALTFDVGGGAIVESGYIRGAATTGAPVQFSDGTRIQLAAGARMSVVAPGPHGARLRVDEGAAHFSVMHLPHAAWSVEAGPYVVEVTGTVFDVRWSSADEVVEVRLQSGSVRVSGPMLTEHATLRPGQHLTAHLATRELRIDENGGTAAAPTLSVPPPGISPPPEKAASPDAMAPPESEPPATMRGEPQPSAAAVPPAAARPHPLALVAPAPPRPVKKPARAVASVDSHALADWAPKRWSERVSAGDAKGVVAEAVAHGIDAAVTDADGAELVALADAARYAGRTYLAERVLRAQRTRFPGTAAAGAAAFFLGRLADDRGAAADGLEWYRRYLSEEPRGPYAAEALGREMIGVARLSGRPAARELAREYLDRFPDGTYLLHAQAILQSP